MGSSWSWPCGERERRRYKVTTAKPKLDLKPTDLLNLNIIRVQTTIISFSSLDRLLKTHPKDSLPSSIVNYPSSPETVIIISQHPDDMTIFQTKSGSYVMSPIAINDNNGERLASLLENNLNWAYSANKTYVGAITDTSGLLYLSYFKQEESITGESKYIVKLLENDISSEFLKEIINDYKAFYRGCIRYKDKTFLILEEPKIFKQKIYAVVEFGYEDLEKPGVNTDISSRIEMGIKKQGLEFIGIANVSTGIALIFAKK